MVQSLARVRAAILTLGVLTSCLIAAPATADAAPAHRAHSRHCAVCRRIISPKQAFKRIARGRPDRLVRRHVTAQIRSARTTPRGASGEAAIQNVSTVTVEADFHASPALESIGVLIPEHAQLKTHDVLARRCPRGPPALG